MDRKRNRHGFGSREKGEKSLKYLKDNFENTTNYSSYDCARKLIKKNIPKRLECLVPILARLATRRTKRNELGLACKMAGRLIVYEIKSTGYDIRDINGLEIPYVWKDFSDERNIFEIVNCEVTYPEQKAEKMKREFEKEFFDRFGLRVKLSSPPKR